MVFEKSSEITLALKNETLAATICIFEQKNK